MKYILNEDKQIIINCDNIFEFINEYYKNEYEFLELKFEDDNLYQELYDYVKDKDEYKLLYAEFYAYGKVVEENNIKFFEILNELQKKKDRRAMFYLGIALINGDGIDIDIKKGLKILEDVSNLGYSLADYQLCIYYANHYAISKVNKYKNLIKLKGTGKSQYMLSISFFNVKNYSDSFTYMLASAKKGYKQSFQMIANMYKNGLGTKKSMAEYENWLLKAKNNGCYFEELN